MLDLLTLTFIIAALVGATAAAAHMVGYIPPRYRRMLAQIQETTALKVKAGVKEGIQEFIESQPPPPPPEFFAQAFASEIGKVLGSQGEDSMKQLSDAVAAGIRPVGEQIEALVTTLGTLGGQALQQKSVPARQLNSMAQQGAKHVLAQIGSQIGSQVAGETGGIVGSLAASLLDDEMAETLATQVLQNPQLATNLALIGKKIVGRSDGGSSGSGYMMR